MTVKNFTILIYLIIELDFVVKDNLEPIFNPKSIAIIGVSRDASALSYAYVHSVKQYGYKGKLYLVNPKSDSILGLKCYSSVHTKYGVRGIPTMLLFKDGELKATKVGATTKSNIVTWIKENI